MVKVGGPVYRIGVGGGAASSVGVQGDGKVELDFGAVQRGDAEMEQKMNRVIRGCIESTGGNIICSIHDQGAGGNGELCAWPRLSNYTTVPFIALTQFVGQPKGIRTLKKSNLQNPQIPFADLD